jgi:hypothetical protein
MAQLAGGLKRLKRVWAATLDLPVAQNATGGAYGSVSIVSLVFLRSVKVSRGRESCRALKGPGYMESRLTRAQ